MSLQGFQRVLVDLTLTPSMAPILRQRDVSMLAGYDLTEREWERVFDVAQQPGLSVHCTLARGNRIEVIVDAFPMTCVLLKPVLRALVDELWQVHKPTNYQLGGEQSAFVEFVAQKVAAGELNIAYLPEILAYEMTCQALLQEDPGGRDDEVQAVVTFQHPPEALLSPLSRLEQPAADLPAGHYVARVTLRGGRFDVVVRHDS
jgi:hypothetical protein